MKPFLSMLWGQLRTRISRSPAAFDFQSLYLAPRFPQFEIGKRSYGSLEIIHYNPETRFEMGNYCSLGANVRVILGGEHRVDWVTTYPFNILNPQFNSITGHPHSKGDVSVGNDVWIGRDAMILSGVTVGDGAVIAAGSVVVKDVPSYGIVGGNPARLLRMRFDEQQVAALEVIRWWEWEEDRVGRAVPLLQSEKVSEFIALVQSGAL